MKLMCRALLRLYATYIVTAKVLYEADVQNFFVSSLL